MDSIVTTSNLGDDLINSGTEIDSFDRLTFFFIHEDSETE